MASLGAPLVLRSQVPHPALGGTPAEFNLQSPGSGLHEFGWSFHPTRSDSLAVRGVSFGSPRVMQRAESARSNQIPAHSRARRFLHGIAARGLLWAGRFAEVWGEVCFCPTLSLRTRGGTVNTFLKIMSLGVLLSRAGRSGPCPSAGAVPHPERQPERRRHDERGRRRGRRGRTPDLHHGLFASVRDPEPAYGRHTASS